MSFQKKKSFKSNKRYKNHNRKCFKCESTLHLVAQCPKRDLKCHECGDTRHFAKSCPRKKSKSMIVLLNMDKGNDEMKNEWYIDSGATAHMCNDYSMFENMKEPQTKEIVIANNERMEIKGIGDIMMNFGRGENTWKIIVRDVNYVPDLCTNLLSVRQITKEGHKVNFEDNVCTIRNKNGNKIAVGKIYKGMYKFETSRIENVCFAKTGESKEKLQNEKLEKTEKLHRILGHVSYSNMYFLKNLGFKIEIPRNKCITCIKAKHSRKPFKKQILQNSRKVLDLVHTDLCGPMPIPSLGGNKYFMTIIDDFSRKIFLYPLKNKSEAFEKFEVFFNLMENQMGKKVRAIRSDNGKKYINKHFRLFCEDKGIIQQKNSSIHTTTKWNSRTI